MRLRYKIIIGAAGMVALASIAVYLGVQIRVEGGPQQLGGEVLERRILQSGPEPGPEPGLERTYLVYRPASVVSRAPVLFVYHGSHGTAQGVRKITGFQFDRLADEQGILVVYPQGYEDHWNDCRGSADYRANVEDIDDVVSILGNTSRGAVRSAMESATYFAGLAGYEAGPIVTDLPDRNRNDDGRPRLYEWSGRAHQVRLYEMIGMGHNAPSEKVRLGWLLDWLIGGNNWDLEWADETWAFYTDVAHEGAP